MGSLNYEKNCCLFDQRIIIRNVSSSSSLVGFGLFFGNWDMGLSDFENVVEVFFFFLERFSFSSSYVGSAVSDFI